MTSPQTDRRQGLVGNTAVKAPVTVVATTNLTQSGEQTVDGVAVKAVNAAGYPDRVLCTGMTDTTKNGIFDVATGSWTRSLDADGNYDLVCGSQVVIAQGSTGAKQQWILTTANPITIGTTSLAWSQNLSTGFLATLAASGGSNLSGFIQSGAGAVATTVQTVLRDLYSIKRWGALVDGSTDDTVAIAATITATGGIAYFPPGTTVGTVSIRQSNVVLFGAGSSLSTLKNPSGTVSVGGTLECGNTALGNSAPAYSGLVIKGLTIDGNRSTLTITDDIHGHGICLTNFSKFNIDDVYVKNVTNAGIGIFIVSNYGFVRAWVDNCGNGSVGTTAGFDINSSSYIEVDVVSLNCYTGARVLDNCYGNNGRFSIYNATTQGFVYQNQPSNASYANNFDVAVNTTGTDGVVLQEKITTSNLRISVANAGAAGVNIPLGTTPLSDCNLDITTRNCQNAGLLSYANRCSIRHRSTTDGLAGAAGTYYATDINGNDCTIDGFAFDNAAHVRGLTVRTGSLRTRVISWGETGTLGGTQDLGTNTTRPAWAGALQAVASAATITLPVFGEQISVTGVTGITSITADQQGRRVVLSFTGILTLTNGSNLKLNGNFITAAGSVLELISIDGANWKELTRLA